MKKEVEEKVKKRAKLAAARAYQMGAAAARAAGAGVAASASMAAMIAATQHLACWLMSRRRFRRRKRKRRGSRGRGAQAAKAAAGGGAEVQGRQECRVCCVGRADRRCQGQHDGTRSSDGVHSC